MSDNIIQLNEDLIKNNLKDLVRDSVEETLNACSTTRRTNSSALASMSGRETVRGYRSGHYERNSAQHPEKSGCACRSSRASSSRRHHRAL